MSTNVKPPKLPPIIHFPLPTTSTSTVTNQSSQQDEQQQQDQPEQQKPQQSYHNPTCSYNPITRQLQPYDYTQLHLQFRPKNNTLLFHVNEYGVVIIQLHRPKVMNSLNMDLIEDLYDVIQHIKYYDTIFRCVVLTSSTQHFCAGLDIISIIGNPTQQQQQQSQQQQQQQQSTQSTNQSSSQSTRSSNQSSMSKLLTQYNSAHRQWSDYNFDHLPNPLTTSPSSSIKFKTHNLIQHICIGWQLIRIPVISITQGIAIGAGFQLILGCDIRLMTVNTKISILESKWGLIPDMGLTSLTRYIINEDKLKLLSYTADFITDIDLMLYNIATKLYTTIDLLYNDMNTIITNIIFKPPITIHNIKLNLNQTNPFISFLQPYQWSYQRIENNRTIHFEPKQLTNLNIEQLLQTEILSDKNQSILIQSNLKGILPQYVIDIIDDSIDNNNNTNGNSNSKTTAKTTTITTNKNNSSLSSPLPSQQLQARL